MSTRTGGSALARPTWRSGAPFLAVAAVGLASTLLPPYAKSGAEVAVTLGVLALVLVAIAASLRRDRHSWVDAVPVYLAFPFIALARDLAGGSTSGLGPLVALPVLWLALTGVRRDLVVAAVLTAAVFLVPMLVIGGDAYPGTEWRRALVWTSFAALVAPVVHRLVQELAAETRRTRDALAELDGIMRSASLTSLITTDVDGVVRSFSAGAEQMLGYDAAEVVGRLPLTSFHDEDELARVGTEFGTDSGAATLATLARNQAPSRVWTYVRKDGRRIEARVAVTELLLDSTGAVGYLAVAVDATAATAMRRELVQQEAQWRTLMNNLPDTTVAVVDANLRAWLVAGGGATRQGVAERLGKRISDFARTEDADALQDLVGRALAGTPAVGEVVATATGAPHELVVTELPDDDGERRALILARDVSTARARESALRRANERSERLVADAPHGVAVLDVEGRVVQANAALLTLIGGTREDVEGHPLTALAPSGDRALAKHLAAVLSGDGASVESDARLRGPRGEGVDVVLTGRRLRHDDPADDILLVHVVDDSERRDYEERLAHQAHHDAITGLANRRQFDDELRRHLEHCERHGAIGALLLLDLDNFKQVNDTLGHAAGDELLVSTAALLRAAVRRTDLVARLGGDEFALLLPRADEVVAESVAAAVVRLIEDHTASLDGARRRVTASVGAVTFAAASEHAADALALADMVMYDAKEAGRSRYAILRQNAVRPPESAVRLEWQARIEDALERDDFVLLLQPVVDLRTDRIGAAEVLMRLRDGDRLVPAAQFLDVAERTGLVPRIDDWVVRHSIAALARLRRLDPEFRIELNLSGRSIGDPAVEQSILRSLAEHDVDPAALVLEITETAAVADLATAREFALRMTEAGCRFALDDFGAGFGSYYYLKHLPFDYVKIDGEFVESSPRSEIDRTIVRSIVGAAHALGKEAIAEFVADAEILEVVRSEGVDHAQGYLLGEPMPEERFAALLAGHPVEYVP